MPLGNAAGVLLVSILNARSVVGMTLGQGQPRKTFQVDEPFDDLLVRDGDEEASDFGNATDNLGGKQRLRDEGWQPGFPQKGPMFRSGWKNRWLIYEGKKLAFCYIEKNACTQFNRLFNF